MAVSSTHSGWRYDRANARLDMYYQGTRVGSIDANSFDPAVATNITGTLTASTGVVATTGGVTATAGNVVATAGDLRVTAGNARLGAVSAFGTTEPTSWIVFKAGTQPAGAITTSGGVGADATTVQKIVAGGTINNVET